MLGGTTTEEDAPILCILWYLLVKAVTAPEMFPREILERILYNCDGATLKNARLVCPGWKAIVDYLTKETDVWKRCCFADIPPDELKQYLDKWSGETDADGLPPWPRLYDNWLAWSDVAANVEFDVETIGSHRRIACVAVAGGCTALGFESGTVKVFDEEFRELRIYRHMNVAVVSVSMVCDDITSDPTDILIYYGDRAYIEDFNKTYRPALFQNCFEFSSYKKFICGITVSGKITIAKITTDEENRSKSFETLTFVRIYSPETVTCCRLWEGVCTILVDNKVKTINYYDGRDGGLKSHVMAYEKTMLQFSHKEQYDLFREIRIFNSRIIVSLSRSPESGNQQIFELYILGANRNHSKKMFVPWQTFAAQITSMYLYGNTFVIGSNSGHVYFYEVHDWKSFDVAKYVHVELVDKLSPILSIDVAEYRGRRVFCVVTNMKVFHIVGYSVCGEEEEDGDGEVAEIPELLW